MSKQKDLAPLQYVLIIISVLLFSISLSQPAFEITKGDWGDMGFNLVVCGWAAFLGGGLAEGLVWLANPLYLVSIFLFFIGNKKAIYFSSAATILAVWFITWHQILTSESGESADILSLGLGYILWLASMVVVTVGMGLYEPLFIQEQKADATV